MKNQPVPMYNSKIATQLVAWQGSLAWVRLTWHCTRTLQPAQPPRFDVLPGGSEGALSKLHMWGQAVKVHLRRASNFVEIEKCTTPVPLL